ncbi:MAG TPA: arylesterase [Thermoanaerobaculia bacterium]|nr:arylesterase [Thermoanaerobaculia bacterium]
MTWRKLPTLALTLLIPAISACESQVSEEASVRQAVPARTAAAPAPSRPAADVPSNPQTNEPLVIFLGDSLTAGLGLAENQAYPALLDRKLDEAGAPIRVLNAGVSGDTTAGGLSRLDWLLSQKPDVLVVGLGANDGLRALPVDETEKNLREIVRRAQAAGARVLLLGMQIPPNYGPDYTRAFADLYPRIAEDLDVPLVPFLLDKVGGIRELNLEDGIHPNAKGQEIVAENVLPYLEALVEKKPAAVAVGP